MRWLAIMLWAALVGAPQGVLAAGLDSRPVNGSCTAPARPVEARQVGLTPVFAYSGLANLVGLYQAPGDASRFYLVQQDGVVKHFIPGDPSPSTFIDISGRIIFGGERGLLGLAFHPGFPATPYVYLSYINLAGDSVLARYTFQSAGHVLDPNSEQIILTVDQPYANHNGGNIAFGPNGYLYWGLGDGGSAEDPQNHAQNVHDHLGAMLRLDVDGGAPYAIPPDNPFASSPDCAGTGCPEIYAWGLRNPWRWSFDPNTDELWAGDVGQYTYEEVDRIHRGGNYGWRCYEGFHPFNTTGCGPAGDYQDPVAEYSHAAGDCSITGGFVYRGSAITSLVGDYVFGDYCTGNIWALHLEGETATVRLLINGPELLTAFGRDQAGELYALYRGGAVYQLVDDSAPPSGDLPALLSQTGYVQSGDPSQAASCMIPYDLNAPLWSDGLDKQRWLALPDGQYLTVDADGDWQFPAGSVLMKQFSHQGSPVETRLFMRHPDGVWAGYSYRWRADLSDADLLTTSDTRDLGGQTYLFPSRDQCLRCHSEAAGHALGPETAQLNRDFTYPSTGRTDNQVDTFDAISMFNPALGVPASELPRLADPADTLANLTGRARAYLHANCAGCHRPGGPARGEMDLRWQTPFGSMNICGLPARLGDLGVAGARILDPGDPAGSVLALRMKDLGDKRMPPLASTVVDTAGTALIDAWIAAANSCRPAPPLLWLYSTD